MDTAGSGARSAKIRCSTLPSALSPLVGRELELFLLLGRDCCADQFSRVPGRPQLGIFQDRACALYALYRTHNFARHRHGVGDLSGAFVAYLREARIASAILD